MDGWGLTLSLDYLHVASINLGNVHYKRIALQDLMGIFPSLQK